MPTLQTALARYTLQQGLARRVPDLSAGRQATTAMNAVLQRLEQRYSALERELAGTPRADQRRISQICIEQSKLIEAMREIVSLPSDDGGER